MMLIISIVALLIGLFNMPYGYYFILKVLVFLSCLKNIYLIYENSKILNNIFWILFGVAILYNPIIKIPLGKPIWTIVNIITIIIFVYLLTCRVDEQ